MSARIEIRGEELQLLPQKAIYWQRESTLFIADPHFGKPEAFRAAALPIPHGSCGRALQRLNSALEVTAAKRLVILGDFWHARAGKSAAVLDELTAWRNLQDDLEVELVLGNHDRGAGGVPEEWNVSIHPLPIARNPFALHHHPTTSPSGYVLAGHIHPAITLHGRGRQRLRLPAFVFGRDCAVLPAFGEFTGLAEIARDSNDRIFAVAGEEVIEVPD